MRQKIDIADVESATKIRAKYLRALENEEFGLLPGPTFVRTFLRTYAEYLGLDAQLLVEEYRVAHEPRGEELGPIGSPSSRSPRRRDSRRDSRRDPRGRGGRGGRGAQRRRGGGPRIGPPGPGAVFGLVLLLLLAVILVLGFTGDDKNGSSTTPTTEGSRQATQDAAARERAAARKRRERAAARRRKQRAAAARTVKLRLVPAEPTYACVVDGSGNQKFGGTLSAGRSFSGRHLRINLGRTTVRVTVNRKRLSIPAGSNPVGYDLRAGRSPRPLPIGQRPNC
jgi:cytoskeleton protein RodZ